MNRETCIFNYTKKCTDCGECEICDLDPNKKCDNCGECLQREGIDTQAIKIDEIKEDKNFVDKEDLKKVLKEDERELESLKEFEEDLENEILEKTELLKDYDENFKEQGLYAIENVEGVQIEYIEDVDGLSELMKDESRLKKVAYEEFPGLIKIRENK
ncbi:hypothetical protein WBZ18_01600 [Clostridium botulinum]|uniref:Uncharacterized protein n=2 Tax=Clostridium botulinum TaxID=1491 RepID=A0A846IAV2_CLOBO|nr:hypothetical protein [Clostridium botulinum]AJD25961.1 hypothetical protein T257_3664 [Clostridium botulinum CDC_297]EPS46909.1 hypothetical protein CFSAN002368_26562 [Clostridium botulinum A1 str. CFSAN002368]ACQ53584.1 conserved hypothetical protein [Clostridium botulinum Ba4 str. 657]AJE10219.1 hypothetical protein T259_2641 [Clostridium botulinum CDC_1436]APR01186.1 hypothetical protein RSJ2_1712 [Clostridium botulinum]